MSNLELNNLTEVSNNRDTKNVVQNYYDVLTDYLRRMQANKAALPSNSVKNRPSVNETEISKTINEIKHEMDNELLKVKANFAKMDNSEIIELCKLLKIRQLLLETDENRSKLVNLKNSGNSQLKDKTEKEIDDICLKRIDNLSEKAKTEKFEMFRKDNFGLDEITREELLGLVEKIVINASNKDLAAANEIVKMISENYKGELDVYSKNKLKAFLSETPEEFKRRLNTCCNINDILEIMAMVNAYKEAIDSLKQKSSALSNTNVSMVFSESREISVDNTSLLINQIKQELLNDSEIIKQIEKLSSHDIEEIVKAIRQEIINKFSPELQALPKEKRGQVIEFCSKEVMDRIKSNRSRKALGTFENLA